MLSCIWGRHHWGMLATFIALGGTAYAFGSGAQSTVHACVDRTTGAVRIAGSCHRGERALTWAKTGKRGLEGPVGPSDGYYSSTSPTQGIVYLKVPTGRLHGQREAAPPTQTQTASQSPTIPAFRRSGVHSDDG